VGKWTAGYRKQDSWGMSLAHDALPWPVCP
jgi:hypothetical protein